MINDVKVFDTCRFIFPKNSKNSTVSWAKQNGKSHQLRRRVVTCLVLPIKNSNSAANELRYNVSKTSILIPDEKCMQEPNQIILRFYEGLNKKNLPIFYFKKIWIINSCLFDNLLTPIEYDLPSLRTKRGHRKVKSPPFYDVYIVFPTISYSAN